MALYGFIGFIIGFIGGMGINAYLLSGVPKDRWLKDKSMRLRYGALNWAIAFMGMVIALAIAEKL